VSMSKREKEFNFLYYLGIMTLILSKRDLTLYTYEVLSSKLGPPWSMHVQLSHVHSGP
jgi:hypothetical protein